MWDDIKGTLISNHSVFLKAEPTQKWINVAKFSLNFERKSFESDSKKQLATYFFFQILFICWLFDYVKTYHAIFLSYSEMWDDINVISDHPVFVWN